MGIVKKYIEEGGGNFLTVKNCKIDATVTIQEVYLDDETFDKSSHRVLPALSAEYANSRKKSYVVINGIYDLSGEECSVRLGVQNLSRISEVLGDDELTWPGQKLICIGTQRYPGLGTQGLLWSGVKVGRKKPVSDASRVNDIINEILATKTDLSRAAVEKLIEEEQAKAQGLITQEAAVHLVASALGVTGGDA